jgi:protoporphyrinogen oxidase
MTITILGAGLSGLACSYYIGHSNCLIFEKNNYVGGHVATHERDGCFWDEGPHVSFTKNKIVRDLFTATTKVPILDYPTSVGNWYQNNWIPHPAQTNLYAVPARLSLKCLEDFLQAQENTPLLPPKDYGEWLEIAFGRTFSQTFPAAYTKKYWTCNPEDLAIDWVGERVSRPNPEIVKEGYSGPPSQNTHYITNIRYPETGGFVSFTEGISDGANVQHAHILTSIDLKEKVLHFENGHRHYYDKLINTIPLDQLIQVARNVPEYVALAASQLRCTSLLLINVKATGAALVPYHWLYVYDEEKFSTRITQTHLLSSKNTTEGFIGLQVEVYESPYRPFTISHEAIKEKVIEELMEMKLIEKACTVHTQYIQHANVLFDHKRRQSQDIVLDWLSEHGLNREEDDLEPMTDWNNPPSLKQSTIYNAGRFAQWKYFWSDDCIMRGLQLSKAITPDPMQ